MVRPTMGTRVRGRVPPRSLGVLAVIAVVALGCGGSDEDPDAGPDLSPDAAGAEDASTQAADAAGAEEPAAPDVELQPEGSGEGDVRIHRPVDASGVAACDQLDDDDPGAVLRFPTAATADAGDGPVTVEVVGCGNTFEATVLWEAYHGEDGTPTLEGDTTGGTQGDWGAFSIVETYWTPGDWTVVVFEIDAESGDRREYDEVTFSVG